MSEKQQRLVYAIIQFLRKSIDDGTVKADDREGLEVAIQCIGEAFNVDLLNDEQAERLSIKPATLQTVFDVFLKTYDKIGAGAQGGASTSAGTSSKVPSAEQKTKAEDFKKVGNTHMSKKNYDEAIKSYDDAITLDPGNPIFYSNRAAAYSSKGDHLSAVGDAEQAISLDPTFAKAYHRLGHAQYSLGDYKAAADAFERGLKVDPNNDGLKSGLQNSRARADADGETTSPTSTSNRAVPDLGGMADMLRGFGGAGGGGGGGGGMPDMASFMNNPQMMAMAQQLMANGGLERLMANPSIANMMNRVQGGGGMPSMAELMGDPGLRDLANQFAGAGSGDSGMP